MQVLDHIAQQQLVDLWGEFPQDYLPGAIASLEPKDVLFVGCNPSLAFKNNANQQKKIKAAIKNTEPDWDPEDYYLYKHLKTRDYQKLLQVEQALANHSNYFGKRFEKLAGETYNHIDLFHVRETNQKKIKEARWSRETNRLWNETVRNLFPSPTYSAM